MSDFNINKILQSRPEILADKIKMQGLLQDYYEGDKNKVNRVMKAYDMGIVDTLMSEKSNHVQKAKIVNKLVNQQDMIEERAKWSVDVWYSILDNQVLSSYKKYQETEKRKKEAAKKAVDLPVASKNNGKKEGEPIAAIENEYDPNDYQCFINPKPIKTDGVLIPCGVGNADNGFVLHGVNPLSVSDHPLAPILAVVYNFLIRNTKLTDKDMPRSIRDIEGTYDVDFKMVYRYEIIIISAMRANLIINGYLNVRPLDYVGEFQLALKAVNHYIELFSRLAGQKFSEVKTVKHAKYSAALTRNADIYVTDNKHYTIARQICISRKINYHLDESNKDDLEYLLREISPFHTFKEGQFESICAMVNSKEHAVCIMPTGSGKSLVYYFVAILQPLPIFVISPTNVLIRDQIRNLRKFHRIDNVAHLKMTDKFDFARMELCNNFVYLTPETFQSRGLFDQFRNLNRKKLIGCVVLDEIHCLSNWGHDFRPEYLMLSKNLNKFLDRTVFLGFTATANYTVVEDIQKQLNIEQKNFFSPIAFEKYNASYHYQSYKSTKDMYVAVVEIARRIVNAGERAIVFAKNDKVSLSVADAIGYEADVFLVSNPQAYYQFADGLCNILVTTEELGIGINFSNVTNIIHFGMPVSKNEYVQEVGRAGRGDEHIHSYVLFLEPSKRNVNPLLLKRETEINYIAQILANMDNDYADIYHKINMNADTSDVLMDRLMDIFSDLEQDGRGLCSIPYDIDTIEETKQYLYMLYATGYIYDWYSYKSLDDKNQIEIMIEISPTNHEYYAIKENMVNRMRERSTEYFVNVGNDRKSIVRIARAKSAEEIIKVYVDWYYEKYLYHHKEEFLDMFDFIIANLNGNVDKITEEIKEYFTLPFVKIKAVEEYYMELSIQEIANKAAVGVGEGTRTSIERINSNRYSYKLDYMLFLVNWRMTGRFDEGRLERFWDKMNREEHEVVRQSLLKSYKNCEDRAKWDLLVYLDDKPCINDMTVETVVSEIYKDGYKDIIYYGLAARKLNQKLMIG